MKLNKLALRGFKSFAEPTEFCFADGITGLVGPNGCGKSNVVDAFKWVLGSRSAKSLRGEEMLDVIFNGSDGVPSAGYAEVSLSFINNERTLPVDYDEVTVTRRLYRSGESEYLINNQVCRLKDIRELFMDTGVGMESYSIIEQGGVDFILQSNPYERRDLFEEAAGISKYHAKKHEAQGKVERVEQDLLRLGDVIKEVKREIRSIKIQATRAEKYKQASQLLKEKKTRLALHQYHELVTARNEILKQKEKQLEELQRATSESKSLVQAMSEEETQISTIDNNLKEQQSRLISLRENISTTASEIENGLKRKTELADEEGLAKKHLAQTTQQTIATRNTLCETMHLVEIVKKEIGEITTQLEDLTGQHQEVTDELGRVVSTQEAKRNDIFESTHKKAQYQNELVGIQTELKNLSLHRDKAEARDKEIERERLVLSEALEKVSHEIDEATRLKETKKSELAHQEVLLKSLKNDLETINEEVNRQEALVHKLTSRLEILEDLEKQRCGLTSGVRAVLEKIKQPEAQMGTIYGILANLIGVEPQYVPALEAGLGDFAQALITKTTSDAFKVIEFVRRESLDRVTTISLDVLGNNFNLYPVVPELPGVLGKASGLVKIDPEFQPVIEMLLGQYILVENLEVARKILESYQPFRPILTLTGEAITAEGVISGGVTEPGVSLLSRKTELKHLKEELGERAEQIAHLRDAKTSKHTEIEKAEELAQQIRHSIYDQEILILEKKQSVDEQHRRQELLEKEKEIISLEWHEIDNQINGSAFRATSIAEVIKQLEAYLQSTQAEMAQLAEAIANYEVRKKELSSQITELKISQAQLIEKKEHLTASIKQLNEQIRHLEEILQSTSDRIGEIQGKITDLTETLREAGNRLGRLNEEKTQGETTLNNFSQTLQELKATLDENKASEARLRQRRQEIETSLNEFALHEQEHSLRMSNLDEKAREEIGVNLLEVYVGYTDDKTMDWVNLSREIDEIKDNLSKTSDVNLSAIDQLKELEERANFLDSQEQDLTKSKHSLQELIRKINRESREKFQATFVKIQENFNSLFRKLFGGGRAELILSNGATAGEPDVLEAGIDIIAKPPEKEAASINLLSGGEKTLTALSLIMGIFQLQPSPFCILDEADATLDEANIDRFIALIQDFARTSQFIVITHNKKTMSGIDRLYGLTMQDSGVSQKISVELKNK